MGIIPIDDKNFESEVLNSQQPFLLDFDATWCGPCRALSPIIKAIAAEFDGKVRVGKLDIDESPETAAKLRVRGAPTIVVFKNGKEVARHVGTTSKEKLVKLMALEEGAAYGAYP